MREYHFPGLSIIVPDDLVAVTKTTRPKTINSPGFTMIRKIKNILIYKAGDKDKIAVTSFSMPIEIYARYNKSDLYAVGGDISKLKLAYWDGSDWIVFTESQNQYRILPSTTGKIGITQISHWTGDPPLAWGK